MTTVRELAINLAFDAPVSKIRQTDEAIERITDEARRGDAAVASMGKTLRNVFVGLGIGAAVGMIGRQMVGTINQFQQLRAQMETIEGSAEKADAAFTMLQEFAATTPFQLQNVVESFARLRAVGLDPTMEDLVAMGDTAAGMGKDILDFADAVTAATTGEAERLKQFGIIMRTQGEQVQISFKGQTQTIKRDANEISKTLFDLGRENFAGGMARQADTIGGAFSNLQDNIAKFFAEVGAAGFAEELVKIIRLFTEGAQEGDSLALVLGKSLAGALIVFRKLLEPIVANIKALSVAFGVLTLALTAYGIGATVAKFKTMELTAAQLAHAAATIKTGLGYLALGAKIMATVAIIALMLLAVEDLVGFLQGKDSLLGDWFESNAVSAEESIQYLIGGLTALMVVLLGLAATVGLPFIVIIGLVGLLIGLLYYISTVGIDAIIDAFANFFAAVEETIEGIEYLFTKWMNETSDAIASWASSVWDPIETWFKETIDSIVAYFERMVDMISDEARALVDTISSPIEFAGRLIGGGAEGPGVDAQRRAAQVQNNRSVAVNAPMTVTIENNGGTAADNDAVAQDLERKVKGVLGRVFGTAARDLDGGTD